MNKSAGVARGAFAFVELGEAVGTIVSSSAREESTQQQQQRRGWEHELASGIDDLIAGLTAADELPPKGLRLDARLAATADGRIAVQRAHFQ
ncbi:hypothetical protein NJ76_29800 [Rhodococcus sp. IITR03]|nr:hypothetical protein NJ76_29800 [Rhodococcus sp. IITR03]